MDEMHFFDDDFAYSQQEALVLQRLRFTCLSSAGWLLCERFSERYDTMVGGFSLLVSQWFDKEGSIAGGFDVRNLEQYPKVRKPSCIVDYADGGKQISVEEAAGMPELADVLKRLKEREALYEQYLTDRSRNLPVDRIN